MTKKRNRDVSWGEAASEKSFSLEDSTFSIADDIQPGTILTDITGKQWRLGKTVGKGGFGEIYLCSDNIVEDVDDNAQYVAKVEIHSNGPLFVEINCYLRIAKLEMIKEWKEQTNQQNLGMPHYIASGSHMSGETKYRFLIISRYEVDLEEMLQSKRRKFNLKTVLTISLQIIDTLEYIHSRGYVHSDIKASNIMLRKKQNSSSVTSPTSNIYIKYKGYNPIRSCKIPKLTTRSLRSNDWLKYLSPKKLNIDFMQNDRDQVYLLDYGLASKFLTSCGEHKKFCNDERRAHAGTLLFCSRDAHMGAQSRRSDLECLGYNIIYWLTSDLPWSKNVDEPSMVYKKKQRCVDYLEEFLNYCFSGHYPKFLGDYFKHLKSLDFEDSPNYKYLRTIFQRACNENGYSNNGRLDFDNFESWDRNHKKNKCNLEISLINRTPLRSNLSVRPILRKEIVKNRKLKRKMNWSNILIDPECIIKQAKNRERKTTESSDSTPSPGVLNLDLSTLNPTYAMIDVVNKSMDKSSISLGADDSPDLIEGYTLAMMLVYNRKKKRESTQRQSCVLRKKVKPKTTPTNKVKKQSKRVESFTLKPYSLRHQPKRHRVAKNG